jgi:SAM-dependent methyltransferase
VSTARLLAQELSKAKRPSRWLLNAGSGVYEINSDSWDEISVDLFAAPIQGRRYAVSASVEQLPFRTGTFGALVCVGEVLAYCDPAAAIAEFARVVTVSGLLICDFGNSRSFRHWFKASFGRAADLVTEQYNGSPERTWIYDPNYLSALLSSSGFRIKTIFGTHTWSALARRAGLSTASSLSIQRKLEWLQLPATWADLMTLVAERVQA